ncbi:MAG: hypothetical protein KAI97_06210, partial [Gemmatimonadetes bacterium]|nr:hypothetical protein [Gemmatimonadota bacterium]
MSGFDWEQRLMELRARHVPDARLGVWDITVERMASDGVRLSGATTSAEGLAELQAKAGQHAEIDVEQLPERALQGA